eukprot:2165756-Prorocentrum_lima.AAC.1
MMSRGIAASALAVNSGIGRPSNAASSSQRCKPARMPLQKATLASVTSGTPRLCIGQCWED